MLSSIIGFAENLKMQNTHVICLVLTSIRHNRIGLHYVELVISYAVCRLNYFGTEGSIPHNVNTICRNVGRICMFKVDGPFNVCPMFFTPEVAPIIDI